MIIKEQPISTKELSILRSKLNSLTPMKEATSLIEILLAILGMILFFIYEMDGYVFISILLAGMFEIMAVMEVSSNFKKEFEALKKEKKDEKGESDV